ncbi:MAG TPA: cation-translocating P-type ATPase [Bacteroidia bacterium]|nr:cation-translocating P-type ATPase [Bacteroidia bacterium]
MEKEVQLNVEGMDCANCAQTITRTLQKRGLQDVRVDFLSGEVNFELVKGVQIDQAVNDINALGYKVTGRSDVLEGAPGTNDQAEQSKNIPWKFYVSLLFTLPLLLHMLLPHSFLGNGKVQLLLSIPVMAIGITHFGRSAWKSIQAGVPNMDVLIAVGSTAAFIYSCAGMVLYSGTHELHNYLFFETAATIITLVLFGNLIEQRSVQRTTTAIRELSHLQASTAKKIILSDGKETISETGINSILKGDLLQVNTGDKVPVDGRIVDGNGLIDEAVISGESLPVLREAGDTVTGSTVVEKGSFRMIAEHVGKETTLSQIIEMVKSAQHSKPPIQKLGDRISAIFVPAVIGISLLTFILSYFLFHLPAQKALMNAIAVLVISCPCAMGLATPTAVMVGLGRAARSGILIKGGQTLETFSKIRTVVFDKTGTLTTGRFKISGFEIRKGDPDQIRSLVYSIEKHSSHPIARSLVKELKNHAPQGDLFNWKKIEEDKGIGINATDTEGNLFSIGSGQMVKHFYTGMPHSIYLLKNNDLIATIDIADEIKTGARECIADLKAAGMRVVLVSGDRKEICDQVAAQVGIVELFSEQLPKQKLELIDSFSKISPTAMVGDGINDAPALSKANIGISMSNATDVAIQSAQVILLHKEDLRILLKAIAIGKATYQTIRQNLFWAFFYNVIAIPFAAAGYLSPMIGALSMAFSDVVVIGNSIRLRTKKID